MRANRSGRLRIIPQSCGRGGFTLIEVLAAILLLSVGLLAVMTAQRAARETQTRAVNLSIGRVVAQSKIEEIRSVQFDSIPAMAGSSTSPSLPSGNSLSVVVSAYPTTSETNQYRVSVTLTWPEHSGTRRLLYETIIARS